MKNSLLIFIVVIWLAACNSAPTSEKILSESVKTIISTDTINTIIALADCTGPNGKYTTEIHSGEDDYTFFKQLFSYDQPFEAVVVNMDSAFEISNPGVNLGAGTVVGLKSHEFHEIIFDVAERHHDFKTPVKTVFHDEPSYRIDAMNNLNQPVELFFSSDSKLFLGMTMRNPDKIDEVIEIFYSDWKPMSGIKLPMYVNIDQAGKIFTFDFTEVKINDPLFARKVF